ncbi:MAG: serpin family protein [Nocardioidaceae bacterium]
MDLSGVVPAVRSFAAELYGRLAARPGNLVYSPVSVAMALTMALAGARGKTATEMRAVLHATGSDAFDRGMNALLAQLEVRTGPRHRTDGSSDEVVLDAANSLWGQRDLTWQQPFLDALARHYGAGMRLVDYQQDPDGAAALISSWTSRQTRGKIPEIIPSGVLDAMTRRGPPARRPASWCWSTRSTSRLPGRSRSTSRPLGGPSPPGTALISTCS